MTTLATLMSLFRNTGNGSIEDKLLGASKRYQPGIDSFGSGIWDNVKHMDLDALAKLTTLFQKPQSEIETPQIPEIMNRVNINRAVSVADGIPQLYGILAQGPSMSDYVNGPAGQGAGQPYTARLSPRFSQPLPRAGQASVFGGYLRGRMNGF